MAYETKPQLIQKSRTIESDKGGVTHEIQRTETE